MFLLSPFVWVLLAIGIAVIIKNPKQKKYLFGAGLLLFIIFSNPFLLRLFARQWDYSSVTLGKHATYSCVIVLGGFTSEDAAHNGYFNSSADRFIEALKLLDTKKATHILISGGNGTNPTSKFTESVWVKSQLRAFNIADSSILVEGKSHNTIENARYSKIIFQNSHLKPPYILVTSAFHMRRSVGIFKKAGMDIVPYPSNYIAGRDDYNWTQLIPDAEALFKWNFYIKEVVGTMVNYLKY